MLLSEAGFNLKEDIELHDPVDSSMEVEQQNEAAQEPYKSSRMLQDRNTVDEMIKCNPLQGCLMCYHVVFLRHMTPCGRPNDMRNFLFARYPRECFNMPSGAQSFRAFWTSKETKASYCTGIPKALEVQGRSQLARAEISSQQAFCLCCISSQETH